MKIYLAGGFTLLLVKGREREIHKLIPDIRRLVSFHFKEDIYKSELLELSKMEGTKCK